MNSFDRALVGDTQEALGRTLEDLEDAHQEIDQLRSERTELLAALEGVAKWCHGGHGLFPQSGCGLCRPVLGAISRARGTK